MNDTKKQLRLDALSTQLATKLDDELGAVELLIAEMAKGHEHPDLWEGLHVAAMRDDRLAELAFAYEQVVSARKFKIFTAAVQAEVLMHAARFYEDVFGDYDGAIRSLESVLAIVPGHDKALEKLTPLMRDGPAAAKMADLLATAALHKPSRTDQIALLTKALELVKHSGDERDRAIRLSESLLKLEPNRAELRKDLEGHYFEGGRFAELAQLLERSLASDTCTEADAVVLRTRLAELYAEKLGELERAMPHLEHVLRANPSSKAAQTIAEQLLSHRPVAARAAGALAAAYDELDSYEKAAEMLTLQLELVRGTRRFEIQKRLATLREKHGDYSAAQAALEPLVTTDPSDDELRDRYIALSRNTGKLPEAARALGRAVSSSKDVAVRARTAADLAKLLLEMGDMKRARSTLQDLFNQRADDAATLFAARTLVDLYDAEREAKQLAAALELLAEADPEPEARFLAASRLARLCEGELADRALAIAAWKKLVDSPMREQALRALESHYTESRANEELAGVLELRAAEEPDSDRARAVAIRAADIRATVTKDKKRQVAIWQHVLAVHGPSREAQERVIPLLEELGKWQDLATVLKDQLGLARDDERIAILVRLAELEVRRLDDVTAALEAYADVLKLDPEHAAARVALEQLLQGREHQLAAANVLEPAYRRTKSLAGLLRVLEVRAASDPDKDRRRGAREEAVDLLAGEANQPERALELAASALAEAVASEPERIGDWLTRIERIARSAAEPIEPAALASHLTQALHDQPVTTAPLARLAESTAEATAASGNIDKAIALYRQVIAFEPTAKRQARLQELITEHGNAEERLLLFRTLAEKEEDHRARRDLMLKVARIEQNELGDAAAAIATCEAALEKSPADPDVEDALLDAYTKAGDRNALSATVERCLSHAKGDRRVLLLLRMGEVLMALGETGRALDHYREVVETADLDPALFERISAAAASNKQADFVRDLYRRRIAQTSDRFERARWLERLGQVQLSDLEDVASAVSSFKRAARLCEEPPADRERARALYERVLSAAPDDVEAAERLLVLYDNQPDVRYMPSVYATLLKSATDERVALERLLEFEEHAVRAGAIDEFCRTVDQLLDRHMVLASERAGDLLAIKARVLGSNPERRTEVEAVLETLEPSTRGEVPAVHAERRASSWVLPWSAYEARDRTVNQLLATAAALETAGDMAGAVEAYRTALVRDPARLDAKFALGRLLPALGDAKTALATLTELRDGAGAGIREPLELQIAALYMDQLQRPDAAMPILERRLAESPTDAATIRLLERALGRPEMRESAAALLEHAADALKDDARASALLEALLAAPSDAPELAATRTRIYERLLEAQSGNPEAAYRVALRAVSELPGDESFWARLDQLARRLDRPEPVAEAYRHLVETTDDPALLERIGRRTVEFLEEWFDDPDMVVALLKRMLVADPTRFAFERLKLLLSSARRWDEFFLLYDDTVARTTDATMRAELLEDAAGVAKDIAKDNERAIVYLERRTAMGDAPPALFALLERLYARSGHTAKLIELLSSRLSDAHGKSLQAMRARLANLWLAQGDEPECFRLAEQILAAKEDSDVALDLLARVVLPKELVPAARSERFSLMPNLGGERASRPPSRRPPPPEESARVRLDKPELHRAALLLQQRYRKEPPSERSVAALEVLLETSVTNAERIAFHRELASVLGELGDRAGVFEHLASLVKLEPSEPEHRQAFITLADALGTNEQAVGVLIEAAEQHEDARLRAELTLQAAELCRDRLKDAERAIELFARTMQLAADDAALVIAAARQLDPLLAKAQRHEQRSTTLERMAEVEADPTARRTALAEAARLAADVLGDRERAIRLRRVQLAADARDLEALDALVAIFEHDRSYVELVQVLDQRARVADAERARRDRARIARIYATELSSPDDSIRAWRELRKEFGVDLESFEALASMFEALGRAEDLAALLEEQAGATDTADVRVELYSRLGDLCRDRLNAIERATRSYREALALDPRDLAARRGLVSLVERAEVRPAAVDGLARAYVETGDWERAADLAHGLSASEDVSADIARAFWWGVARHERDVRGELEPAESALLRARTHDPENLEILSALASVQGRAPGRALIETLIRLSDAKGGDLRLLRQATDVALRDVGDRQAAAELLAKTLSIAVERWTNIEVSVDGDEQATRADEPAENAGAIAAWAIDELVRLSYEDGNYRRVVELLSQGAELPFEEHAVRRMRRDAATILAERLGDTAEAIALYRGLIEEDPSDEIATQSVEPLASLLAQTGAHAELAALWEKQAEIRGETDRTAAADLWSRAAKIAETELNDLDRAVTALEHAAALFEKPVTALEALARVHAARNDLEAVTGVLERLLEADSPESLPATALRLADTHLGLGNRAAARDRLERAVERSSYDTSLCERLHALYEEDQDFGRLAELHTAQAKHATDKRTKLAHLKKAADLCLSKLQDRERAVPLLEQALELAPDTPALSLSLADALSQLGRLDRAREVLGRQLERYEERRPKHRAQVHFALGRVLNASGDRKGALAELESAARIDPTHSGIVQALARLAHAEGQLERARQSYEALLLLRAKRQEQTMSRAEILLELAKIAEDLNEPARADELRESAQVLKKTNDKPEKSDKELEALDAGFIDLVS